MTRPSLPMLLTLARLAAAPLVACAILWADRRVFVDGLADAGWTYLGAFALFAAAAITDALDGALARAKGQTSPLGGALDHAADKALTTCTLAALAVAALPGDLVFAAIAIMGRDVAVAGLREGLALAGRRLPVDALGKLKTGVLMAGALSTLALQAGLYLGAPAGLLELLSAGSRWGLWAAAALALWSGGRYLAAAFRAT